MTTDQKSKAINAAVVIGIGIAYLLGNLWSNRCDYFYVLLPKSEKEYCDARMKFLIYMLEKSESRLLLETK